MPKDAIKQKIFKAQINEITDHVVYKKLAAIVKSREHAQVLERIAADELKHYGIFKEITGKQPQPRRAKIFIYVFISRIFGLNFGLRLMERGEDLAQETYPQVKELSTQIEAVIQDENRHEIELLSMINEENLKYISSMVLGLNDALVELTGALAGFTLAIQNTKIIGTVGLITGIAASMSMAASEYLSAKQEDAGKNPLKASLYTGTAYVCTVLLLIIPYLLFKNIFFCLGITICVALIVILAFTFYMSVAKGLDFKKRFMEMALLSLSIAAINFVIGLIIRNTFGVEI